MTYRPVLAAVVVCLLSGPAFGQAKMEGGDFKGTQRAPFSDSGEVVPRRKSPPPAPAYEPTPIDAALRQQAREAIETFATDPNPVNRANAIEAAKSTLGEAGRAIVLRGLSDDRAMVRFAACIGAGDLKYVETRPVLFRLAYDTDPNVRLAARYGLHKIGDTTLSQELVMPGLRDDRIGVRSNAVMLLGLLGEKSAIPPLQKLLLDSSSTVRIQVVEALWRLGDESVLDQIVARTVSPYADEQTLAVLALGQRRNIDSVEKRRGVMGHIRGMLVANFPEVELAAARSLGQWNSDEGLGVALKYATSQDARQRGLSAFALGEIGRPDTQDTLKTLLADRTPEVRLAAAAAILKLREQN